MLTYGTNSVSNSVPKIWSIESQEIENCKSLDYFKKYKRKWKPICPCRLCKTYLLHNGFYKKVLNLVFKCFCFCITYQVIIVITKYIFLLYIIVFCYFLNIFFIFFTPVKAPCKLRNIVNNE